jgi:hypothetical protein
MANLPLWIEFYYDLLVAGDMPSCPEQKEALLGFPASPRRSRILEAR